MAPSVETSASARWETLAFAGLQWYLSEGAPQLVFGVRRTETETDQNVAGAKFDISFPLNFQHFDLPSVRFMGVAGNRDVQGEWGVGWRFKDNKALIGIGVQGPFVNAGADYVFGSGFDPFLGVNTLRRAAAPEHKQGGLTCPSGYNLTDAYPSEPQVAGKTCMNPPPA